MSDIAIRVDSLGKQYRIGKRERYRTLRDTITDVAAAPYRKVRSMFADTDKNKEEAPSDLIWALKDVSFEVPRGSVVGVIGRNGAGKSTLLKVLSRITEPTAGLVEIHGRVGSLLEVGTGFHPELTGRENISLNGAILGMRRTEIARKFDEIVAFAEIDKFIDTPVKHYSSGMYMRLAFAVAAHLEPEILIVDEVLAVGDAQFQKKCLGKMGDVAKQGRTVVFVSHNMTAIRALCSAAILLRDGTILDTPNLSAAIALYAGTARVDQRWQRDSDRPAMSPLVFRRLDCQLFGEQPRLTLSITGELASMESHGPAFLAFDLVDATSSPIFQALPRNEPFIYPSNQPIHFEVSIELPPLIPGNYRIHAWVGSHYTRTFDVVDSALAFTVETSPTRGRSYPHTSDHGAIVPPSNVSLVPAPTEKIVSIAEVRPC